MDDCRKYTRPPGVVAFWMPKPGPAVTGGTLSAPAQSSLEGRFRRAAGNIPKITQNPRLSCGSTLLRLVRVMHACRWVIVSYRFHLGIGDRAGTRRRLP